MQQESFAFRIKALPRKELDNVFLTPTTSHYISARSQLRDQVAPARWASKTSFMVIASVTFVCPSQTHPISPVSITILESIVIRMPTCQRSSLVPDNGLLESLCWIISAITAQPHIMIDDLDEMIRPPFRVLELNHSLQSVRNTSC